jgi:glycogen debranching enzyme
MICFSRKELIPSLKLWEFFCVDVEVVVEQFKKAVMKSKKRRLSLELIRDLKLQVNPSAKYERNAATLDIDTAVKMFNIERYVYIRH